MYDLVVIGGGINGAGIARDAAGRGLSVLLAEKDDLAQATSSASTKLIHGGLRYLEQYDFKLVSESLAERERLLHSAPHIIWPMTFILPHEPHLRPAWLIRLGLYLYDCLGKRQYLPASQGIDLQHDPAGKALKDSYKKGFSYADCWADDARLVVLCAKDAQEKGATICTRTTCTKLIPQAESWSVTLHDTLKNKEFEVQARAIVNAAGPWARTLIDHNNLSNIDTPQLRYSKGSHIIIPKLYDGDQAYLLQQPDGRIVFTIPYETRFTLVGTTDVDYHGDPNQAAIDNDEIAYLCDAVSRSFQTSATKDNVTWTYSGVRALFDSGDDTLSKVTRDYKLDLDLSFTAPLLNIFGGKLTTFRKLSEDAVNHLMPHFNNGSSPAWTQTSILPGGDISQSNFDDFIQQQELHYPWLSPFVLKRYARAYGTRLVNVIGDAQSETDLGFHFGDTIYEAELRYLIHEEWARTSDDILWRRSKLGLHISEQTRQNIEMRLPDYIKDYDDT